eukprot:CAMPEP_0202906518 /NCGR_PEP_ID=MMETSP1392-20130828/39235_1 /ASSEMBLY_ACC=CAM_ASM_000868 /TAXON_ID=225041 /ORGANISM="Chlamydomonas chlamydogama, Strain SAG 11-48b" /LENGTH=352 /DNA_ID=CAMNT_0049595063 /DNA_START=164 /DNA_END=1223 /DNA_ORIENTATION=+
MHHDQLQFFGFFSPQMSYPAFPSLAASPLFSKSAASGVQVRHASTTDAAEGGEEDSGTPSFRARSNSSTSISGEGDEDSDDTLSTRSGGFLEKTLLELQASSRGPSADDLGAVRRKAQMQDNDYRNMDKSDNLEHLIFAKESFMRKSEDVIPIPPNVREVMYRFSWDKVLVDVRRTVDISTRGKDEVYTAMVAVGNLKGLLGLGMGEARTAQQSVAMAYMDAYARLCSIPLYRGHTIYHQLDHKYHHMQMRLMPRAEGWGIKASDLLTDLCLLAGIRNISIKTYGRTKNKFYVAHCLLEALTRQSTPYDGIEGTGVYAREVWQPFHNTPARDVPDLDLQQLPMGLRRGVHVP